MASQDGPLAKPNVSGTRNANWSGGVLLVTFLPLLEEK
jgi:hypothetical protein